MVTIRLTAIPTPVSREEAGEAAEPGVQVPVLVAAAVARRIKAMLGKLHPDTLAMLDIGPRQAAAVPVLLVLQAKFMEEPGEQEWIQP